MRQMICVLAMAVAGVAHAFTTNTWNNANTGNTPATAYDWSDPDNWSLDAAPADYDTVKFPTSGGMRYIKMPSTVTVAALAGVAALKLMIIA